MPYSPLLLKPFRDELITVGVQELHTAQNVDKAMDQSGTTLETAFADALRAQPARLSGK